MNSKLTIGSRGSKLALAQTHWVAAQLKAAHSGLDVDIKVISTKGDQITDRPLSQIGGKGLFTKELEVELLGGSIDCAVHSLKDLPTELPDGLALAAVPKREDPRDVLVTTGGIALADLPAAATIGTSSLRRAAQLRRCRPDIEIVDLRGNIDTRIRRVQEGDLDAAVLAAAGIRRLELDVRTAPIDEAVIVPAPGQGALGIEVRDDDSGTAELFAAIQDRVAVAETTAERRCLAVLEGGCQVPLGVRATCSADALCVRARVCSLDGTTIIDAERNGATSEAAELGERIARDLLDRGAAAIVASVR